MKICFKCGVAKPLNEYYRHPQMGDGHLGKCKACTCFDMLVRRQTRSEYLRAYERKRASLPHRRALRRRINNAWDVGIIRIAHNAVHRALKTGLLTKEPCEMCGSTVRVHAHHDDYEQPLAVIWLCAAHHHARHIFLRYLREIA